MKKLLLAGFVIVVFILYSIYHNNSTAVINKNGATVSDNSSDSSSRQTSSSYKDGTYTGAAEDAFYGTVQVRADIQNGKITDVQFIQYPKDQSESQEVSDMAIPVLKQEAIQAQSANVDTVSGATQTSEAFNKSLADALSQAK